MTSRIATGVAAGGIFPVALAVAGDLVPIHQRQVAISRLLAAGMLGNLLGIPMAGIAVAYSHLNKLGTDAGAAYAWVGRVLQNSEGTHVIETASSKWQVTNVSLNYVNLLVLVEVFPTRIDSPREVHGHNISPACQGDLREAA